MSISHLPSVNFGRAARRLFAVVSRSVSSGVERVAFHSGDAPAEYYRFPWF
jgi:hypothetical protein